MSNVTDLTERRLNDAIKAAVIKQGDDVAKALMNMSKMSWCAQLSGPEALHAAARAFQVAAEKMK